MKTFAQLISETRQYDSDIDADHVKKKIDYHHNQREKLEKELVKHNKTSPEARSIKNDISAHSKAAGSYGRALVRIKYGRSPSSVKEMLKSAENHASKASGNVPEVAKKPEKIKNIHAHVHKKLIDSGFKHETSTEKEQTKYIRKRTPYSDTIPITLRGTRTNTIHTYTKPGTASDVENLQKSFRDEDLHGYRGNHDIQVRHIGGNIHVTHKIIGKSEDDAKHNEREYNYVTAAHYDPESWGTRYKDWKKG